MPETRLSIAHVLPGMNFGGVEVAILKSYHALNQEFDYDVFFIRSKGELDVNFTSAKKSELVPPLECPVVPNLPLDLG